MRDYEKLLGLMADFASAYLKPAFDKRKAGQPHELTTDKQFSSIFYGLTEITATLDALLVIEIIVGTAPPRAKKLEKDHYFQFLIGAYLQEIYILEQRLSAYARKISRLYLKPNLPEIARRIVYEPLQGIISTRGAHVHSHRFTDLRLDAVSTAALFRRLGHELGDDLDFEYRLARKEWQKTIKTNNQTIRLIIDQYCALLLAILCKGDKIFIPAPRHASGRS